MDVRTVEVRSPSVARETGNVIRAVIHILFWSAALLGASWKHAQQQAATGATGSLPVDQIAFRDLSSDDQRMYRRALEGLVEAEDVRTRTKAWPTVEALAEKRIPPFAADPLDKAGYTWRKLQSGVLVNYVGVPQATDRPTLLVVALEPEPGAPADPGAVVDETHHKLGDGTMIHVGIYTGTARPDAPLAQPAYEDGWRHVTEAGGPTTAATGTPEPSAGAGTLRVGVTLHPYYSWVANVIQGVPGAEVVAVLPGEVDAGNYQPSPDDIAKLMKLDALVVNAKGHDDFIDDMVKSSGNGKLVKILANAETPMIKNEHGEGENSHTFISFTNAIQQTKMIAKKLGELRPESAERFRQNAAAYAERLRGVQAAAAQQLAKAKIKKVVTVHDGYSYLLQEFGIALAGVVQPAHGLTPSAKELGEMVELMKKEKTTIVLTEEDFPEKLLKTLQDETGAKVYIISHVAVGQYAASEFETVMQKNADTLVKALVTDP